MKKRFSAILLVLMMMLTFSAITAAAETTPLEVSYYNIISNNIRLEFSGEVTEVTAVVKGTGSESETTIAVTATADSADKKVWNLKLSEKMDITKKYMLSFTATPTDSATYEALTATKLITFKVIVNDDFNSYTDISGLDDKYVCLTDYNWKNVQSISGSGKFQLVEEANGNKRILASMSHSNGLWRKDLNYSHTNKYYNCEIDLETTLTNDGTGNDKYIFGIRHTNINVPYYADVYFHSSNDPLAVSDQRTIVNNNAFFKDSDGNSVKFSNTKYNYAPNNTYAFSLSTNGTNDIYNIYENGTNLVTMKGTYPNSNFFYILESHYCKPFYIDNYKLYTASMADYAPMAMDLINVTTKGITVSYNGTIDGTPEVHLFKGDNSDIKGTVTVSGGKINIVPSEQLDLSKKYLLKIGSVSDGVYTAGAISKLISFKEIVNDDFESYESLTDLDSNFSVITGYGFTKNKISGYTDKIELVNENGNQRLLMKQDSNKGFWTNKLNYNHEYKYYNFEADMEYIDTANKWYFVTWNINFYTEDMWHIQAHQGDTSIACETKSGQYNFFKEEPCSFGSVKYNYTAPTTYAMSLSRNESNSSDVFNIYTNGTNVVSASGTVNCGDNFFYILGNVYGSRYYLDNYKLYTYNLVDADAFPEFGAEKTLTTSKYIKVTFNEAIDETDLASKVSVTSLGSNLPVNVSLENSKKTLVIAPVSGMFAFDREITYKIDGLSNVYGTKANYIEKKIMLQKLWYETFDNATDLSDLYGSYGVVVNKDAVGDSSISTVVQPLENYKEPFSIVSDGNGGKRLAMTNTNNRAFTHFEKYPFRANWVDYTTEFDFETSGDTVNGLDYNYRMWYVGTENGIGKDWYQGGHLLRAQAGNINDVGAISKKCTLMTTTEKNASGSNYTLTIYKDDVPYATTKTYGGVEGEFGFANFSSTDTLYIDNIKCYKVVDYSEDEALFITGAAANKNKASGSVTVVSYKDQIPAGQLIVTAYDSDNKLIGIYVVDSKVVEANGYSEVPYTVECSSNDIHRISVFLWDGLDTMTPIMNNRTTTEISVVTSQPVAAQ